MMEFHPAVWKRAGLVCRGAGVLALAAAVSWPGFAQEQQSQEQQNQQQQEQGQQQTQTQQQGQQQQGQGQQDQGQQSQQPPQSQSPDQEPPQAPPQAQNPNRPPVSSRDRVPDNGSYGPYGQPPYGAQYGRPPYAPQYGPYGPAYGQQQYGPQSEEQPFSPAPDVLTIPPGTVVVVRLNDFLSSDKSQIGDRFAATLEQPLIVNGYVVARRGQTVIGQVKSAKKAGRVSGTSQLGVELTDVTLVDGQQAPVLTELWKASGGTSHGADAATIVGGSALGAAIGAAADWGRGAAIGGGAGAIAGIGAVLLTRGRPTVLAPESELSFKLVDAVKVDTTHSSAAFVPPQQQDFGRGRPSLRGGEYQYGPDGYGPNPYPPCGYAYPCYYGNYGPYVGVYPGFWWGGWYGRGFYGRGFYGFRRF